MFRYGARFSVYVGLVICIATGAVAQTPKPAATTNAPPKVQAPATVGGEQGGVTRSPHGKLNLHCEDCHTFTSWKPIRSLPEFDHNKTKFPLRGLHVKVECRLCHTSLVFTNVGHQCADCHADIHRGQFGKSCDSCHSVKGWQVSLASIKQHQNRFPLMGAHATLDCEQCHRSAAVGQFAGLSTQCANCHLDTYQGTTSPNHKTAGFPPTCESCHGMDSWFSAKFDHARLTGFALTGAHAQLECTACHTGGRFAGTPANCYGCHATDFQRTTNPNHVAAGFPQDCSQCHTTATWLNARFDHSKTRFPLTGAHLNATCSQCHVNGQYTGTPTTCSSCHLSDFQKTTNPNHVAANFPQDCSMCHNTTAWRPSTFDHSKTGFSLTGAHVNVACAQCHVNGRYAGTPTNCASCHLADFQKTTNPNHVAAGFPTDCSICHSTVQWLGAKFDHSKTMFPLTGAHANQSCSACHSSGVFAGLSTACSSCHLSAYNSTTNPNHKAAGFPTDCSLCHTTTAWVPSSFNHNLTNFPLTGKHVTTPCASCHIGGRYAGTPTDCYSCHRTDFQNTTNPNHMAANFPTTCGTCHNTTSWLGAVFNHTQFPIYSGTHANAWTTCADCHTNPSNFQVFSCITCHAHDKPTMDSKHSGIRGYVYNSSNCYSCHPQGTAG